MMPKGMPALYFWENFRTACLSGDPNPSSLHPKALARKMKFLACRRCGNFGVIPILPNGDTDISAHVGISRMDLFQCTRQEISGTALCIVQVFTSRSMPVIWVNVSLARELLEAAKLHQLLRVDNRNIIKSQDYTGFVKPHPGAARDFWGQLWGRCLAHT